MVLVTRVRFAQASCLKPSLLTLLLGCLCLLPLRSPAAAQTNSLTWRKAPERVTADISSASLEEALSLVIEATGWQVYIQPKTTHTVDVRFKDRPPSEALKLMLGSLSFAVIPQTNGPSRLLVFRTGVNDATEQVMGKGKDDTSKPIPNELVITLKPGVNIDDIAKKVGGKVVGRNDALRVYRLQFETAEAAEKARKLLSEDPDVAKIENNYNMERPPDLQNIDLSSLPELGLKPVSPTTTDCDKVIVGLIDTSVPKTGGAIDAFLLPQIDVAGAGNADYPTPPHGETMANTILRGADYSSKGKAQLAILPVNVYGQNAQANTYDVANGVYKAINAGAKIINMSLGSDAESPFLSEVIRQGKAQDIIFVAAAGNKPTTTATYPAADSDVIAVTASDRSGQLASYANRGDFVDVIAPGTTLFRYNGQTYMSSGTSVSTAYVSGLAASMADPCGKSFGSVETQIRQNLSVKK